MLKNNRKIIKIEAILFGILFLMSIAGTILFKGNLRYIYVAISLLMGTGFLMLTYSIYRWSNTNYYNIKLKKSKYYWIAIIAIISAAIDIYEVSINEVSFIFITLLISCIIIILITKK